MKYDILQYSQRKKFFTITYHFVDCLNFLNVDHLIINYENNNNQEEEEEDNSSHNLPSNDQPNDDSSKLEEEEELKIHENDNLPSSSLSFFLGSFRFSYLSESTIS